MARPLATTGIVFILAIFILLQQADLRDRFIRLCGMQDLHRTTHALDDAARRLSRYFLTQLGVNAGFGMIIGFALLWLGLPSPWLWGTLAALFRFIPYIGTVLAASLPIALAAAIDPGWDLAIWTAALFLVSELIMGQVVDPLAHGRSTGLSPVAVVIATIFWSWMWGPIGLILAMPLTVCLVVLGRQMLPRPASGPTHHELDRLGHRIFGMNDLALLLRCESLLVAFDHALQHQCRGDAGKI